MHVPVTNGATDVHDSQGMDNGKLHKGYFDALFFYFEYTITPVMLLLTFLFLSAFPLKKFKVTEYL